MGGLRKQSKQGTWSGRDATGYDPTVPAANAAIEHLLAQALAHANAGRAAQAMMLCEQAREQHPPHAAVLQLLALLRLRTGDVAAARGHAGAALAMRPDHLPTLAIAVDVARACGALDEARTLCERIVSLSPDRVDVWFQLALLRQDLRDLPGAAAALRELLQRQPAHAEAEVNLGIVLQEAGDVDEALRAYGRALRLREDTFGRIAHALAAPSHGRMWLSLDALRRELLQAPA
jgi:tetratricopeptide (TPR) repeat protein